MPVPSPTPNSSSRALARFPAEVQAAHARFIASRDVEAADLVLLAVVRDYLPSSSSLAGDAVLKDEFRLIEDLGFDSLAIAEIVFFLEDLYQVRIPQDQLVRLSTIGDLRAHLRAHLRPGSA